jgi:hypothetical protein
VPAACYIWWHIPSVSPAYPSLTAVLADHPSNVSLLSSSWGLMSGFLYYICIWNPVLLFLDTYQVWNSKLMNSYVPS